MSSGINCSNTPKTLSWTRVRGLAPPSLRSNHHNHFACAYALRAMLGAPQKRLTGLPVSSKDCKRT